MSINKGGEDVIGVATYFGLLVGADALQPF